MLFLKGPYLIKKLSILLRASRSCETSPNKYINDTKLKKSYYLFYLNLIGKNRKVYSKTDCLFIDFINAFPIFKEMLKENFTSSLFNRMARNI